MENQHQRLEELFWQACQFDTSTALTAFLDEVGSEDSELRGELEAMLAARTSAEAFAESIQPASHLSRRDMSGEMIGPYKLREKIGEGGMGVVYTADQKFPVRRRVAVKVIKPGMDSEKVIARFEAERQTLALMDHPNIAKILGAGTTQQGLPYFAMELVHGVPITQYCDERRLTIRQRLELLRPVCRAVQHAHQKGIIHRDLKPSNILVTQVDGEPLPKIIDFGIAKAVGSQLADYSVYTEFGMLIGTLEYMSPEQAQQNQFDIDTRSDIYSLGVVLYELLAGATPFDGKRLRSAAFGEILKIIATENPLSPSLRLRTSKVLPDIATCRSIEPAKLARVVHGDLDWIVMKSLEKDRVRRYGSAAAFENDIARFLEGLPVDASPPSSLYRTRKFISRHKTFVASAALLLLSLGVGLALTSWQAHRATRASKLADQQRRRAVQEKKRADQQRNAALTAKERAENEAAYSIALTEFLEEDLLGMVSIGSQIAGGVPPDPDLKVVTLVQRAADKLDKLDKNPMARARMEVGLAKALYSLGRFDEAIPLARRGVESWTKLLGPHHAGTVDARMRLARCLQESGERSEAIAILRRLIALPDLVMEQRIVCLFLLAQCLESEGQNERAAESVAESVNLAVEHLPADNENFLMAHEVAGDMARQRGDSEQALAYSQAAYMGRTKLWGPKHFSTIESCLDLAKVYVNMGQPQKAVELLEPQLETIRTVYGGGNDKYVLALMLVARGYWRSNHPEKALHFSELSYQTAVRHHGLDDDLTFRLGANHAQILRDVEGLESAAEFAESLVPTLPVTTGEPHADLARGVHWVVEILFIGERWKAALQLTECFLDQYEEYPLAIPAVFRLRDYYTRLLTRADRYDESASESESLAIDFVRDGAPKNFDLVFHHRYHAIVWKHLAHEDWLAAADALSVEPTIPMWKYSYVEVYGIPGSAGRRGPCR